MIWNFVRPIGVFVRSIGDAGPIGVLHPSEMAIDARQSILTETLIAVDRNTSTVQLIWLSVMWVYSSNM